MNKITVFLLVLTMGFGSCKNAKKEINQLEMAKQFYIALDQSNSGETRTLITDTFTTVDDGFEQSYSRFDFARWVQWDSVFKPTYSILKIEEENGVVKASISKTDTRISFLHSEPIITDDVIHFENNKIHKIVRTSASFNVEKFVTNRDTLVTWIEKHHPELNGFILDQTRRGAINYLKAIELYSNKNKGR